MFYILWQYVGVVDQQVNWDICFLVQFLFSFSPCNTEAVPALQHRKHKSVHLLVHPPTTYKPDIKLLQLLFPGQRLTLNKEGAVYRLTVQTETMIWSHLEARNSDMRSSFFIYKIGVITYPKQPNLSRKSVKSNNINNNSNNLTLSVQTDYLSDS